MHAILADATRAVSAQVRRVNASGSREEIHACSAAASSAVKARLVCWVPPTPLIFAKKLILTYFRPQISVKNPTHINFANS